MKPCFLCAGLILLSACLASCSDGAADVMSASGVVVAEYADADSPPDLKLSVFVQLASAAQKSALLQVEHRDSGWQWNVEEPVLIGTASRQWAGYTNLRPVAGEPIPGGQYTAVYSDRAEYDDEASFSVVYPEELRTASLPDAIRLLGDAAKKRLVLYDADGMLLFCDGRKNSWHSVAAVKRDYPSAASFRLYYMSANGRIAVLAPVKSIEEFNENDAY